MLDSLWDSYVEREKREGGTVEAVLQEELKQQREEREKDYNNRLIKFSDNYGARAYHFKASPNHQVDPTFTSGWPRSNREESTQMEALRLVQQSQQHSKRATIFACVAIVGTIVAIILAQI